MRKLKMTWGVLFLLSLAVSVQAQAQEPVALQKIAVVNLGKLFDECRETKASESELEKLSKEKQTERERLVSEIKSLREELVLLNEETRLQRQQTIEQKLQHLSTFDQEIKNTLMKKRDESVKGILEKIEGIVTAYAKQNGYELIVSDRAVLYRIDAADITDEVLKTLNKS